jgi:hypothetical protein
MFMRTFMVRRVFRVLLTAAVMVLGISVPRAGAVLPQGEIKIQNAHSGLCLSPAGGGVGVNGEIVQYLCDEDPSRLWTFRPVPGQQHMVQIVNVHSGLCLTIAGGSADRNIASVQYTCDGDPSRKWNYTELDGGVTFRFINLHSGLCLTVAGGATGRNIVAVQFPCDNDPSRNWKVIFGR